MLTFIWRLARFFSLLPLTLLRAGFDRVRPRPVVLELLLDGRHPLRAAQGASWSQRRDGLSRLGLERALRAARRDARVDTVLVRIGHLRGGWADAGALRAQVAAMRGEGRRVVAYLHHTDLRALWVASACSEVWASPNGVLGAAGLGIEQLYWGETLSRVGVGLDVVTAGAFKSAMEPLTRTAPTPENREALEALVGDLAERVVADIAAGRALELDTVRAALDASPLVPEDALARGLVSALVAEDDLRDTLDMGPKGKARRVRAEHYRGRPHPLPRLLPRRPALALVEVHGAIRDGGLDEDAPPSDVGASTQAVCQALERAAKTKRVRGVLLHINSPGGSATASERMWRAVRAVAEKKPVIALMGDVAASGGYYIASAAHGVVAAPGTLTGSIGVLSAKPVVEDLLARVGVHVHRIERGERTSMFSLTRRYGEGERTALERTIAHVYALFLKRVAEGRGRSVSEVEPHAQGRVWTGAQAAERGLVDRLGYDAEALAWLGERAGVDPTRGFLVFTPKRPWLRRMLGRVGVAAESLAAIDAATRAEGPQAWCGVRWSD
jgi:protease-4